jgi:hypothetical protein
VKDRGAREIMIQNADMRTTAKAALSAAQNAHHVGLASLNHRRVARRFKPRWDRLQESVSFGNTQFGFSLAALRAYLAKNCERVKIGQRRPLSKVRP